MGGCLLASLTHSLTSRRTTRTVTGSKPSSSITRLPFGPYGTIAACGGTFSTIRWPLEVSAACQFAYAFQRGVDAGLLEDEYERLATHSMQTAASMIATDGEVKQVALTPGGPGAPIGGGGHGQGWFLLAAEAVGI